MVFARRVLRRVSRVRTDLTHKITCFPTIESKLIVSYNLRVADHRAHLPELSVADGEIVSALRRTGVHVTSLAALALPFSDEMFEAGQSITRAYEARAAGGPGAFSDPFLVQASAAEKLSNPQLFTWGLNIRLLNIVENYLELPVAFGGVSLFYTLADGRERGARVWHRDGEDRRIVKIAVYFNDVGEDGGPLEILHRPVPGATGLKAPPLKQDKLERALGGPLRDGDVTTCIGPAGTVVFSDTATHYHRGKPAITGNRSAAFYNYYSQTPRYPYYCERSAFTSAQIAEMTKGLTPYQRSSALWRDTLPTIAKLVLPRSPH